MPPISFAKQSTSHTCQRVQGYRDALYMTLIKTCFSFKIFRERGGNWGVEEEQKMASLGNKEK